MDDLRVAASAWRLDPAVAFLNHGSFGACPQPVLDAQTAWRERMEAEPVLFLDREIDDLLSGARARVTAFLRADAAGLAFVANTTTAVSTVLASHPLGEGDEIVTTDHAYGAVRAALRRACERTGATLRIARIPLPLDDPSLVAGAIARMIGGRTRLVVADHVSSPSALVFPVEQIVAACRERDVPVMIDAAHSPGMIDAGVDALAPDFWCGNLHKWLCAPKGSAVLWVSPDHRDRIRPLATSHDHLETFHARFDWTGTYDPTPILAAPAAVDFFDALGWDRVRAHNDALAEHGRATVAAAIGAGRVAPEGMHAAMSAVPLRAGVAGSREQAMALTRRLYDEHRIEVPVNLVAGQSVLRLSAQLYNAPADYERLAAVLPSIL